MRYLLTFAAFAAGALCAAALVALLYGAGIALAALLSAPPGALQLGAALLCAVALRPAPPAPVVVDHDEAMLWGLLLNTEVPA